MSWTLQEGKLRYCNVVTLLDGWPFPSEGTADPVVSRDYWSQTYFTCLAFGIQQPKENSGPLRGKTTWDWESPYKLRYALSSGVQLRFGHFLKSWIDRVSRTSCLPFACSSSKHVYSPLRQIEYMESSHGNLLAHDRADGVVQIQIDCSSIGIAWLDGIM